MKNKTKLIIDISMIVLLPMLMAYSLIGETLHEIIGTASFVLFITHHLLNRRWNKALLKGKYTARRVFITILDSLLLILMIIQPMSGILMSKHLYTFLPVQAIASLMRKIHLPVAYWSFMLMSIHSGTHIPLMFAKLQKRVKRARTAVVAAAVIISVYGIYAFFKRGLPGYMFLRTTFAFFDYSEPIIAFLIDYVAVMIMFGAAGSFIIQKLGRAEDQKMKGEQI